MKRGNGNAAKKVLSWIKSNIFGVWWKTIAHTFVLVYDSVIGWLLKIQVWEGYQSHRPFIAWATAAAGDQLAVLRCQALMATGRQKSSTKTGYLILPVFLRNKKIPLLLSSSFLLLFYFSLWTQSCSLLLNHSLRLSFSLGIVQLTEAAQQRQGR